MISIVPDFLGYLCIAWGLRDIKHTSARFVKCETISVGMALASGILFVTDILGFGSIINFTLLGVDLLELIGFLVVLFLIFRGVQDIETAAQRDLRVNVLKAIWIGLAVVSPIAWATSLINRTIAAFFVLPTVILDFAYILAFYRCKVAYEEYIADQD